MESTVAEPTRQKWIFDSAHSEIEFKVRHMMVSNVRGFFTQFDGSIYTSNDDFTTAEIDFVIYTGSVDTGNQDRDNHLKNADFFNVEKYPEISFQAVSIEKVDNDGSYELWGNLTITGITKKIKLDVEFGGILKDPWGNEKAGFTITGKINRSDFHLNWNTVLETGGMLVSDEVKINAEVQLMRSM